MGNMGLPLRAIRTQIVGAVDLIVQVERQRDGKRRVTQVTDVLGMEGEMVTLNDIFHLEIAGESQGGELITHYKVNRARPSFHERLGYFQLGSCLVGGARGGVRGMKPELFRLLLAACFCLAGLVVSVVLLFRDQRRKAQRNTRIDGVAEAYRQSRSGLAVETGGLGLSRRPEGARLASKLAELLRYDPAHRAIHPAPLSAVLTLSLIPSLVLAYFVVNFIGPIGWAAVPVLSALLCRGILRLVRGSSRGDAVPAVPGCPGDDRSRGTSRIADSRSNPRRGRENAEPTAREFTALVAQTAIGVPLDDALREMAERNRLPEYRFFATALSLQSQTGGGLTETLENLADTIRKRVAARLRGHALAAEARIELVHPGRAAIGRGRDVFGRQSRLHGGAVHRSERPHLAADRYRDVAGRRLHHADNDPQEPDMNNSQLLLGLGGLSLAMTGAGFWLLRAVARQDLRESRIDAVRRGTTGPQAAVANQSVLFRLLGGVGALLSHSGLLPAATLTELEQTLVSAGLGHENALGLFIGGKLVLCMLLPLVVFALLHGTAISPMMRPVCIGMGAIVGLLLPDFIVRRRRAGFLAAVGRGLPDALDMLVICSEAGLGLELGLERVASEIQPAHPAIAAELKLTSGELRILADRRMALTNMGTRTGLETLKRLGATLIQTLQYGTPLSQALRTLSAEMRYEMLMRFEAQAARLPVLLTVPMILFILPALTGVHDPPLSLSSWSAGRPA